MQKQGRKEGKKERREGGKWKEGRKRTIVYIYVLCYEFIEFNKMVLTSSRNKEMFE